MWLLIFFLTPIVEMYLLIEVGGYIGAWPTIALVMITAVIGVTLLRIQGLSTLTRGVSRLQGGELPAREMVEGLLLAVAGALLLTPGFVTDGIGFVLLTPPLRAAIAERVLSRVQVMDATAGIYGNPGRPGPGMGPGPGGPHRPAPSQQSPGRSGALEGEFERLDEDPSEQPAEQKDRP
jgi:UPF0716 protein FxsA